MRRAVVVAVLAVVVADAGASGASASVVSQGWTTQFDPYAGGDTSCARYSLCGLRRFVVVAAAPGERNDVRVELVDPASPGGEVVVEDAAGLTPDPADPECRSLSPTRVSCGSPPDPPRDGGGLDGLVTARTGDGDDRVHVGRGLRTEAELGAGDDVLSSAGLRVEADGGAGDDVLRGAAEYDDLRGGAGADVVRGGDGDDELDGGDGADVLLPGAGGDRVLGGAGDDLVAARDGRRDRISCGRGRDAVTADRSDVRRGCER